MKHSGWKLLLGASLLVNLGVVAALFLQGWRGASTIEGALFGMRHEQLAEHLRLDDVQRARWQALEAGFVESLRESAKGIEAHRARLVREVMSAQPDAAAIERERAAIFALQEAQQRTVIAQLLKERELLRPAQREALAEVLLAQGGR